MNNQPEAIEQRIAEMEGWEARQLIEDIAAHYAAWLDAQEAGKERDALDALDAWVTTGQILADAGVVELS